MALAWCHLYQNYAINSIKFTSPEKVKFEDNKIEQEHLDVYYSTSHRVLQRFKADFNIVEN